LWALNTTVLKWSLLYGNATSDFDSEPVYGNYRSYDTKVAPGARFGSAAFYESNSDTFFVSGGMKDVHSMFQFNISSSLWRWVAGVQRPFTYGYDTTPGYPPTPRTFAQSFYDTDLRLLYVFGGILSTNTVTNDMWRFDASDLSSWIVLRTSYQSNEPLTPFYDEPGKYSADAIPGGRYGALDCY
jgi:hypothetical protein